MHNKKYLSFKKNINNIKMGTVYIRIYRENE